MLSINLVYRLPQHVKTFVTTARHWALPRATARMFVRYRALNMVARLNTPTKTQFATGWTVQGWNPGGVEGGGAILRNRPDRPRGPPNILYYGYRVKRRRCGFDHPPHLARLEEK